VVVGETPLVLVVARLSRAVAYGRHYLAKVDDNIDRGETYLSWKNTEVEVELEMSWKEAPVERVVA
jgi:hypothetical protein